MGERKQPSPDLFIAQKTMAFMLCLYNPCFPASARDPDKDNKTNKMPVGGPLTPRANCAGVRDSIMSGLSPPFVQGARGKPKVQGEEQTHGGSSGHHPNAWATGIYTHPRCPARPGCSSATCRNLSTTREVAWAPPTSSPRLPSNAGTMLGRSQGPPVYLTSATPCAQEEVEVCRPGVQETRSVLCLSTSALPPSPPQPRKSLHRHHTHTHR